MQQAGLVFIKYVGATKIGGRTENRQGLVSAAAPFEALEDPVGTGRKHELCWSHSEEDRDWQGMDWAPWLFELNKSIMLTALSTAGIGKGKGLCYILQMHCKCLFIASLPLTGQRFREANAHWKEGRTEVMPNE